MFPQNTLLSLIIFLFFWQPAMTQEIKFKNYKQEEGLPSNEVYDIFQDRNGFVWFATDRGLAHYDGYEFNKFEPANGLTDITVFDFFPQENGQVWCTTFNNKLFYFEDGTSVFIPYKYNKVLENFIRKVACTHYFINSLALDKDNNLFMVADYRYYIKIDTKGKLTLTANNKQISVNDLVTCSIHKYTHTDIKNKKQSISYISEVPSEFENIDTKLSGRVISDGGDKRIIYNNKSVLLCQKGRKNITILEPNHEPIEAGIFDRHHFWVSYRGKGAWIYDYNGHVSMKYLDSHSVTRIFRDCFGSLWFSTIDAGVFLQKQEISKAVLKDININSLTRDDKNNLYAACYNGDVYRVNALGVIAKIHSGVTDYPAYTQYSVSEHTTFFSSDDVIFNTEGTIINKNRVVKISDDGNDLVFIQYGLYAVRKDKKEVLSDTLKLRINDVSIANNKTYLATLDGLMLLRDGKMKKNSNLLCQYRIEDIDYEPQKKRLYLASMGAGVVIYNPVTGKAFNINKSNGLSNDLVTEIVIENKNVVWACTNYGLNKIVFSNDGNYKIYYITTAEGLLGNQVKDIEIIKDTFYIATTNGLCSMSRSSFDKVFSERNYFLHLKEVKVNTKVYKFDNEILNLDYSQNQLDFFIESVSPDNELQTYRYKLQGLDENWHYTAEKKISYEFLPPGNYKLIVQAIDNGRLFSTEKINIEIKISNPFWKTWWFIILTIFFMAVVIYTFFRIRVLTYNQDIVRELLRLVLKKIKRKEKYFLFKEQGKEIRIMTDTILYVKSSGNYLEIVTPIKRYIVRIKIGEFISKVPDPFEFLRIHRSYIIRIDKVDQKAKKSIYINQEELPVGESYSNDLNKIIF